MKRLTSLVVPSDAESGNTAIEYALVAGFIGMAIVVALNLVGVSLEALFNRFIGAF